MKISLKWIIIALFTIGLVLMSYLHVLNYKWGVLLVVLMNVILLFLEHRERTKK